jgi:hypothetical protein
MNTVDNWGIKIKITVYRPPCTTTKAGKMLDPAASPL